MLILLCGVLMAAAVLGAWAWAPDRARASLEPKYAGAATRYEHVAGTVLRVRDTGSKTSPALLMLHGFGSSLETWEPWATALSADYRVVRFDLPGSGLSSPDPTGRYDDVRSVAVLLALMDELRISRAVLIGNSLGGRIAWKFAAAHPERVAKLVLISPDGFASPGFDYGKPPKVPTALQLMKYFLPKTLLRANLAAAYADAHRLTDPVVDRYYELLLASGNREAMIERMQQTILEDPRPVLRRIETPTLLLWGEKDRMIPFTNAADYLRELPHGQLISYPTLGHVPYEESPQESLPALVEFLRQ